MGERELGGGAGDTAGLGRIRRQRLPTGDGAEATGAGAHAPEQHEGDGPPGPALRTVGAARFLADGVETEPAHHPLETPQLRAIALRAHALRRQAAVAEGLWPAADLDR